MLYMTRQINLNLQAFITLYRSLLSVFMTKRTPIVVQTVHTKGD